MSTRFYLPSGTTASAISPAADSAWENAGSIVRKVAVKGTPSASAMSTLSFSDGNANDQDCLLLQYVYGPIAAQTIQAQTINFQARYAETNSGNNLVNTLGVRVIAPDGTTVRGTVLAVTRESFEMAITTLTDK